MFSKQQKIIIITLLCLIVIGIGWFSAIIFFTPTNTNNFEKPTNTNDFETSLRDYKANFQNYVLGNNEATYKDLIAQSEQAILNKDDKKILELKPALKALEDKVISENTNATNTSLQQLKSIDISKLPEDKKKQIESLINEISPTIGSKNFVKANASIEQAKVSINNELKALADAEAIKLAEEKKNKTITPETARELILKEDSIFANSEMNSGSQLSKGNSDVARVASYYDINEGSYAFVFTNPSILENDGLTSYYYVGINTGNVYRCSSAGGAGGDLSLVKNNKVLKILKYKTSYKSSNSEAGQLSSENALNILKRNYPNYLYVGGGQLVKNVFNASKGFNDSAYLFTFKNTSTGDFYQGAVFLDGSYTFKFVGNKSQ